MPLRVETEECRECGQSVMVMAFKWTGFCSGDCREEYDASERVAASLKSMFAEGSPFKAAPRVLRDVPQA